MTKNSIRLRVEDMVCAGCVNSVTKAVHRIDEHASVDAHLESRTVLVATDRTTEAVVEALASAGFPSERDA